MFFKSHSRTSLCASTFTVDSINPWNALPTETVSAFSLNDYKQSIDPIWASLDHRIFSRQPRCELIYLLLFYLFGFVLIHSWHAHSYTCVKSHNVFIVSTELPTASSRNLSRNWPYLRHPVGHYVDYVYAYEADYKNKSI